MTKKKTTKRALLMSALSLMMCVTMFVGSTFAWFTDEVTSGVNIITAGNLDVELYHSDKAATDEKVTGETILFDDVSLWEPGVVAYENLVVKNEGNLALKYQLALTFTNATKSPRNGRTLADVLKVAVVRGGFNGDRAEAQALTFDQTLSTFTLDGELREGQSSETYGIVIYWQPGDNDNDFNMNNDVQGKNVMKIDLGVSLFATQLTHEYDSFDNTYDEDAYLTIPEIKVETPTMDALVAALEAGETAVLTDNMTLSDDVKIPAGVTAAIDLNGKILTVGNNEVVVEGDLIVTAANGGSIVVEATGDANADLYAPFFVQNGGHLLIESGDIVVNSGAGVILYGDADLTMTGGSITANNGTNAVMAVSTNSDINLLGGTITAADSGSALYLQVCNINMVLDGTTLNGKIYQMGGKLNLTYSGTLPTFADDTMVYERNITKAAYVTNSAELADAITNAATDTTTYITLASGTYTEDINITLAAQKEQKGDLVFKAEAGANPVITGTVTLGQYEKGTLNVARWEGNVTFENITFDHAEAEKHSIDVQNVNSLNLLGCTIIGDGDYGIGSASGGNTGASEISSCTFQNAGMQILGNFGTNLMIVGCTFNESRINVQAGNGVTVQNCKFNNTLTDANVDDSFYLIRSNSTPIAVSGLTVNVDSNVSNVAADQAKWGMFWNRGTTNWTVNDVVITLSEEAQKQPELQVTKCTSTGRINVTGVTINGVPFVSTAEALSTLLNSDAEEVKMVLADGTYNNVLSATNKNIHIKGGKGAVISITQGNGSHAHQSLSGCDVTLEGVTCTFAGYYPAYINDPDMTYIDCTLKGQFYLYGDTSFIGCTFENGDDAAKTGFNYVYTYGNTNHIDVLVDTCVFNTQGHGLIMYSDNGGAGAVTMTVKESEFHGGEGRTAGAVTGQNTAAIEIDGSCGASYTLNLEGNNTFDGGFSGLWRIKAMNDGVKVTVNGTEYTGTTSDVYLDGVHYTKASDNTVTIAAN